MLVHVVRHPRAKPESDTVDDEQRQVTKKGAKKFIAVLKQYVKAGEMSPDAIFAGAETRNMQAAEIARDFFGLDHDAVMQSPNLGPGGDPAKAFGELQTWAKAQDDPDNAEVLVIGSNPALASLFQLIHGLNTKAGVSGGVKLKKGSVAKLKVYDVTSKTPKSELRSYLPPGLALKGK